MTDERPINRRRLQFSLLSLLVLMTATCLVLGWWFRPQPVEVVSLIRASGVRVPLGKAKVTPSSNFINIHDEVLAALNDPALIVDTISIVGNGKLRMLRNRRDPATWLRERLTVEVVKQPVFNPMFHIVSVKLSVPEQFKNDAIECVDYMVLRVVTNVDMKAARLAREQNPPKKLPSFTPQILQTATATNSR